MTAGHDGLERLLGSLDPGHRPNHEAVLAAAAAVRPPGRAVDVDRPATPLEVLRDRIADFAAAVAGVEGSGWDQPAHPYPWTVKQLVAHLAAVEEYVGHLLGVAGFAPPSGDEVDHLAMTAVEVERARALPPQEVSSRWHGAATSVADHIDRGGRGLLEQRVRFHGFDLSVSSLLIVRGFELWTHADDVRRATGRAPLDPPAAVTHTMSNLSVSALPLLVTAPAPLTARVVLTGPGGGAWTIGIGGPAGDEPDLEVLASAVDWCRLASRRVEPDDLPATVDGDEDLARRIYTAAQAMAF